MSPTPDIAALEAKARALTAGGGRVRIVAIEARASSGSYDRVVGRVRPCIVVSIVTEQPSHEDSRYRSDVLDRLIAEDAAAEAAATTVIEGLAAVMQVPVHRVDSQTWIASQPAPPARPWPMQWTTTRWGEDGVEVRAEGEATLTATSGSEALRIAAAQLFSGIAPPYIRTLRAPDLSVHPWVSYYEATCPVGAPTIDGVRSAALAGAPVSTIFDEFPATLSTLRRMIAIEHAFHIELSALAPLAAYANGTSDRAALDAALAPLLKERQPRWSLVGALRETHAAGDRIGPVLRAHHARGVGTIHMMIAFREAFSLGLAAAKMVVSTACDGLHDDEVESLLAEALAKSSPEVRTTIAEG